MDTFFLIIAGIIIGSIIWFTAQAAQLRIHPERLLKRLTRKTARRILWSAYQSSFGSQIGNEITSLANHWGLPGFDESAPNVDKKLDMIEKIAGVVTNRELSELFKYGYGDDVLIKMIAKMYDNGQLPYLHARIFNGPKYTNLSASYDLDGLKNLVWATV